MDPEHSTYDLDLSDQTELADPYSPRVCIVGAGISGLRCADILARHGIKVTIIEARDRIGGRIHQSDKLGYPADLGPNWIHASNDNPILHLATETNTPLHVWNEPIRLFDSDGKLIELARAQRLSELRWNIIEESFEYSSEYGRDIPASESLYDFFLKKAAELDLSEKDQELLLGMCQMWGDYTGDRIQRQSLKYVWLEEVCGGDECIVASTFAPILDKVAELPLSKASLQFNTRAVSFTSRVNTQRRTNVEVATHDGSVQCFDEVVVTAPLGWLKVNKNAFDPPINGNLSASIDAISIGHLEKVYITFPQAFWRGLANGESTRRDIPEYTNWISPQYAPDTNPYTWPQEAYDLAAFEAPYTRPTLLLYTFGDLSAHISSIVHNNPTDPTQYELLNAFFQPYYSRLPHYDPDDSGCKPTAFLATAWQYDDLAGNGSYCNLQVGIDGADKHIQTIQHGMPDRGIWIAGEHGSPFDLLGTVAGAYVAGEKVAERIIEKYRCLFSKVGLVTAI